MDTLPDLDPETPLRISKVLGPMESGRPHSLWILTKLSHDLPGLLSVDFGVNLSGSDGGVAQDDSRGLNAKFATNTGSGVMSNLIRCPARDASSLTCPADSMVVGDCRIVFSRSTFWMLLPDSFSLDRGHRRLAILGAASQVPLASFSPREQIRG